MNQSLCPSPQTKLSTLVLIFLALGMSLWGVIAIATGLMDGYYARLGKYIEIGDIIVLVFTFAGVIFFTIALIFTIRCNQTKKVK